MADTVATGAGLRLVGQPVARHDARDKVMAATAYAADWAMAGMMPDSKVVFFSSHEDPVYVTAAFEAGAMGYLVKHVTVDLGHYLGRVLQGERVCCPDGLHTRVARTKDT